MLAVAVSAMAAACFMGAERVERLLAARADPLARAIPGGRPRRWVLTGFAAVGAGALAGLLLAGASQAGIREVRAVSAAELAQRVLDSPWEVRVIDVRPREACAARRVPGAECVLAAELPRLRLADADPARLLVVVDERGAIPPRRTPIAGGWRCSAEAGPPGRATPSARPVPPAAGALAAELEAYRIQAGIQSALTGMKAAPPPPPPSAAPAAPRKTGGGCSG